MRQKPGSGALLSVPLWWRDALNHHMAAPSLSRRAILAAGLAACAAPALAQNAAQPFTLPDIPGPLRPLGGLVIDPKPLGGGGFSGVHLAPDLTLTLILIAAIGPKRGCCWMG